jgi:hypothetical protein
MSEERDTPSKADTPWCVNVFLSPQDEWLGGMRKTITIEFYKDGELVGKSENLPGDKIKDAATKAKVSVGDEVGSRVE